MSRLLQPMTLWKQPRERRVCSNHPLSTTQLLAPIVKEKSAVQAALLILLPLLCNQNLLLLVSIFHDLELKASPWCLEPISGDGGWTNAAAKAKAFVQQLTIDEKVNLTTGVDTVGRCVIPSFHTTYQLDYLFTSYRCVGNTGTIPRLGFEGFCLQDSPVGVRNADYASVFPSALNAAMTWDKDLMKKRGKAMGAEFRGKGVNVAWVIILSFSSLLL